MSANMPFIDLKAQYQIIQEDVKQRIEAVLNHGMYIMGPEVDESEKILADFAGTRHAIVCASGTDALVMALIAGGVEPGDEVLVPSFSFIATAEAVALLGAKPVFVDVQSATLNLDPDLLEAALTPRTKAIIPVSLYGQIADMDEINAFAEKHRLLVIEDGAQSFGATYKGRRSCNLSAIGCTSFFPAKPLGCYGDGGAVFTNHDDLAQALREIRVHGSGQRYFHTRLGINGRLDSMQCAVIVAKMRIFPEEILNRQKWATAYNEAFSRLSSKVTPVVQKEDRESVWAQYTVRVDDRDAFQKFLAARGVPTAVHYPLAMHQQPFYKKWAPRDGLPVAEQASQDVVSLPICGHLMRENFERVVTAVSAYCT